MSSGQEEVATVYSVQLLYNGAPKISKRDLLNILELTCPGIAPLDGMHDAGLLAFTNSQYVNDVGGHKMPAQWMITPSALDEGNNSEAFAESLEQSWSWPEAKAAIDSCTHSVLIGDVFAAWMPPLERLGMMQRLTAAVMKIAPCQAVHWMPTQQFVSPESYTSVMEAGDIQPWLVPGAVNIRYFQVVGYGDDLDESLPDMIADSVGLGVLGLPDVQCHFKDLDHEAVVQLLYNHALSTFEKGATISEGQSIAGLKPGQLWRCRFEESMIAPKRTLIDIDPGTPHAAGVRT